MKLSGSKLRKRVLRARDVWLKQKFDSKSNVDKTEDAGNASSNASNTTSTTETAESASSATGAAPANESSEQAATKPGMYVCICVCVRVIGVLVCIACERNMCGVVCMFGLV